MSNLIPVSPLMQKVEWNGKQCYTSQYFHQQYLANSQAGGKYRRYDSFMRLLRSMPVYQDHVGLGDIVILDWTALKQEQPQICGCFRPLFQAAGGRLNE